MGLIATLCSLISVSDSLNGAESAAHGVDGAPAGELVTQLDRLNSCCFMCEQVLVTILGILSGTCILLWRDKNCSALAYFIISQQAVFAITVTITIVLHCYYYYYCISNPEGSACWSGGEDAPEEAQGRAQPRGQASQASPLCHGVGSSPGQL